MKCCICNTEIKHKKKYDNHISGFHIKLFLKKVITKFNFLIPSVMTRLKSISSMHNTMKKDIFKGYIGICSNCGHGEMMNPPTQKQLIEYYENEYWTSYSRPSKLKHALNHDDYTNNPRAIHQVELVTKEINPKLFFNVLEIGAGAAYASLLLRSKYKNIKINLNVCEPGKKWQSYYNGHGINKISNYFPFDTEEKFEYIHTSHWLEHVLDLNETISKFNTIIKPSGYIFVEVPNTEHFYWDLPVEDIPHIHFFTRKSLIESFSSHGFECVNIGEYGVTYIDGY